MADQNSSHANLKSAEAGQPSFGNVLDSGLVRSVLAASIAIVGHLILAKVMEAWSVWQMVLSFVFLTIPAVAWVFWPHKVVALLRAVWIQWLRVYPVVGALALAGLIGLVVFWLTNNEPLMPRIRLTCDDWIGWAPLYIAKEKRFFENTAFEFVKAHGSGQKRTKVYRGDADAIGETVDMLEFSSSASAVAPGVILWAADRSNGGYAVVANKDIKQLSDLVGKTVGLEVGTPGHFMLLFKFRALGLDIDKLHIRDLPRPEANQAFKAGKVHATAAWSPHLQDPPLKDGNVILSSKEMTDDYAIRDVVAVDRRFLSDHRDAVRDFFIGWCAALQYMKTNRDDAYKIMAANLEITVSELDEQLQGVEFCGYEENQRLFISGQQESPIVANVQKVRKIWQDAGFTQNFEPIQSRVSSEIIKTVSAANIDERINSALSIRIKVQK